jgi:hypothetical protein
MEMSVVCTNHGEVVTNIRKKLTSGISLTLSLLIVGSSLWESRNTTFLFCCSGTIVASFSQSSVCSSIIGVTICKSSASSSECCVVPYWTVCGQYFQIAIANNDLSLAYWYGESVRLSISTMKLLPILRYTSNWGCHRYCTRAAWYLQWINRHGEFIGVNLFLGAGQLLDICVCLYLLPVPKQTDLLLYITGRCVCWSCLHYHHFIIDSDVMMLLLSIRAIWNFAVRQKINLYFYIYTSALVHIIQSMYSGI